MNDVTLNFYLDGFGVSGSFSASTGISPEEWGSITEDEQVKIASELYHENVLWGYDVKDN